jgi:acetate CoA/acetoacetate CoA-transferase alpha subunit
MLKPIISITEAASFVKQGSSLMVGGFLGVGSPECIISAIVETGVEELFLIANDTSVDGKPLARLVELKRVKKAIASHIGTNSFSDKYMHEGIMEIEIVPLGTLTERIRAHGYGLGGFLTPTGVGTLVEQGKQKINVDGKDYLLELPIGADVAIVKAWKADLMGNLVYRKSARNCNPLVASAGKITIAEVEHIVDVGEIDPEDVHTPGIFVNYLVQSN